MTNKGKNSLLHRGQESDVVKGRHKYVIGGRLKGLQEGGWAVKAKSVGVAPSYYCDSTGWKNIS